MPITRTRGPDRKNEGWLRRTAAPTTHACGCGPSSRCSSVRSASPRSSARPRTHRPSRACVSGVAAPADTRMPGTRPRTGPRRARDDPLTRAPERRGRPRRRLGRRRRAWPGRERRGCVDPGRHRVDARDLEPFVYAEITREGRDPQFILDRRGRPGRAKPSSRRPRDVGRPGLVARLGRRPGRDRARSASAAHLGAGRRSPPPRAGMPAQPRATRFGFRFERVSVSYGGGGSWRPFVPGSPLPRR